MKFIQKLRELFPTMRELAKAGSENSGSSQLDVFGPDKPIREPSEDRFNRWPFAERVAQTIASRKDTSSIVIGIFGVYGDGKTSVLNMMEYELRTHDNTIPIRFNPWQFGDQAQLIRSFFKSLTDGIGKSLTGKKEKIGEILEKYGDVLVAGAAFGLDISGAAKGLGRAMSNVELEDLRSRLEKLLRQEGKRVVIIMDDIDRLDRTEIQSIFKLAKLSADFDMTAYVLAFDKDMVAAALAEKYGGSEQGDAAGHSFLEKIIQVPLNLPPAERKTLRQITFEGVDAALHAADINLSQEDARRFASQFIDGIESRVATPRMAKRFANVIAFSVPLLKGEVDTVDLLLIEAIRIFYPSLLYRTIVSEPATFLGSKSMIDFVDENEWKKRKGEVVDRALQGLHPRETSAARELLEALFPRIKQNYTYTSDWDEKWAREKRIAADDYFPRYFQYAIPAGDIPDQTIQDFLKSVAQRDVFDLAEDIRTLCAGGRAEAVVAKLRAHEKTIIPERAEKLAFALARVGDTFPSPPSLFDPITPSGQAAILITNLVRRIPAGNGRDDLARRVVQDAEPLAFAVRCLQWLRKRNDQTEEERLISEAAQTDCEKGVAQRVAECFKSNPLHLTDQEDAALLYGVWSWWGDKSQLSTFLQERFSKDPSEAAKFVVCFLPTAWGGDSGFPHKAELMRDGYDSIANLTDPETIVECLKKVYGNPPDDEMRSDPSLLTIEERAARQFMRMHRNVHEETSSEKTR